MQFLSNHGWGNAIDVSGYEAQQWIKKNGENYGWYWGEEALLPFPALYFSQAYH